MTDKQKSMLYMSLIVSAAALVIVCVVVLFPKPYEAIVKQDNEIHQIETTPTTGFLEINLNTADFDDLMTLPDMTAEIAANILDYRFYHGEFPSIEALRNVEGVTRTLCKTWYPYIFV